MDDHPFPPPQPVALPIAGIAQRFTVRWVSCIGRNHADHAREMGHGADIPTADVPAQSTATRSPST